MSRAQGFTLLELVVTIVIAAILAALAIPHFNQREIDASWFNEDAQRRGEPRSRTAERTTHKHVEPGDQSPVQPFRRGDKAEVLRCCLATVFPATGE